MLDEAQTIKNARSQAHRALARITAERRVCLTGTPVENHLGELWSIFDWLAPGLLGDSSRSVAFGVSPSRTSGTPNGSPRSAKGLPVRLA